ncbi:MAG: phospho-sugar mutase [Bacillota bacterium]|nr:phospho-sugar mutase [Bacillota bacterium]
MDIEKNFQRWLNSPVVSESTKEALRAMSEQEKGDAFFKDAEFGTGGMRAVLGPGTNRMNEFTVGRVAISLGEYVLEKYPDAKERGIVISHDNRHMSREFTLLSAQIFNQMGIKAYIFDSLRPTPELSYAVRYVHAVGGVMVTASHNPPQYNGYKVYDDTGCQLVPDKIQRMLDILASHTDELNTPIPYADKPNVTITFDKKIDDDYCREVEGTQINPDLDKRGFKIVYTPQHGASYESAMQVFKDCGYEIYPVEAQCVHDPDFGATKSPNPENPEAFEGAIELGKKIGAQLLVTTDPDGDRCGLGFLGRDGEYHLLTGNQSAGLLLDYILSERKKKGVLPKDGVIYDTIVSSSLCRDIATSYGVATESFLTGFKFIGDRIGYYEQIGHGPKFQFGYEESYGCLVGDFVRDKDGVQAILLYSEMALYHYLHGENLAEAYEKLQAKYGYHNAFSKSLGFAGPEGAAIMKKMMEEASAKPLSEIAGIKVLQVEDYEKQTITRDGKAVEKINLPKSAVVKYVLVDKSTVTLRPSGTEPKVKFYVEAVSDKPDGLKEKGDLLYKDITTQMHVA